MRYIIKFFKWFLIINSGVLLIFALNTMKYDYIKTVYLFEIFAASAATTLPTVVLFSLEPKKVIPKYCSVLMILLHYICLLVIMLVLGSKFEWIELNFRGILCMALSVAGVYIVVTILSIILGISEANKLNEALKSFNG